MTLLVVECVAKSFDGHRVLSSASLRARRGELRILLGCNGAGKSTLLKISAGCMTPDNGSIQFEGRSYLTVRLQTLAARGLFYLPDRDLLSTAFTIRQQLAMISRQFPGGDPDVAAREMDISDHLDKRASELAGGEKRRAELAAALVRRPKCLLADEPYRGLTPKDAEALTTAFRELARSGTAVVVSGNEVATLLHAADHVTWCTSGTTYELGSPSVAMRNEAFRREYLGSARDSVAV